MTTHRIALAFLTLFPFSISSGAEPASRPVGAGEPVSKKLIEFGWDEPNTGQMRRYIDQMKRTPFDGCVFHVTYQREDGKSGDFLWNVWGNEKFTLENFRHAIADLDAIDFGDFRHNFLRFNVAPGKLSFFDDYTNVINNARIAAHIAHRKGVRGILFDTEQYDGQLFSYQAQRDRDRHTWEEYVQQAGLRGREVMTAFQDEYPDITLLLTFSYMLPYQETQEHPEKLRDTGYALLPAFVDGMLEAARGQSVIIDGNESAYRFKKVKNFETFRRLMRREALSIVADPARYSKHTRVSHGLWMDFDSKKSGWNADDPSKNPHTPESFEPLVVSALRTADEFVWIYSEVPRWWSDEGKPVKLHPAYATALRNAKRTVATQPAAPQAAR